MKRPFKAMLVFSQVGDKTKDSLAHRDMEFLGLFDPQHRLYHRLGTPCEPQAGR